MIDVIAFDADDTLWHNERLFRATEREFRTLLARYHDEEWIEKRLYETEVRNLEHYGYGIKAFMLSMVETAVELTEGRVTGDEIRRILDLGRAMLATPVGLLDGVEETLDALSVAHTLMVITKGDLLDQETKVERSGLRDRFQWVEVVSRKEPDVYRRILDRYGIPRPLPHGRRFAPLRRAPRPRDRRSRHSHPQWRAVAARGHPGRRYGARTVPRAWEHPRCP